MRYRSCNEKILQLTETGRDYKLHIKPTEHNERGSYIYLYTSKLGPTSNNKSYASHISHRRFIHGKSNLLLKVTT